MNLGKPKNFKKPTTSLLAQTLIQEQQDLYWDYYNNQRTYYQLPHLKLITDVEYTSGKSKTQQVQLEWIPSI